MRKRTKARRDLVSPILIGCEESQTVCSEFRKKGYLAFSCDLLPTRGNPDWHIQGDVVDVIMKGKWKTIILHPPCTHLAVSGNRHYAEGKPDHYKRLEALKWTLDLWKISIGKCDRLALENPQSVIFKYLPNVFYIQPWQFGHPERKKTGFATIGLPKLEPTRIATIRKETVWKMGPSKTRGRDRSKTFRGIARAMVSQWG